MGTVPGMGQYCWPTKQELHSNRMHTARLLTVSPSMLCAGEGGVCLARGGVVSQHALRQTPSPREQNHRRL